MRPTTLPTKPNRQRRRIHQPNYFWKKAAAVKVVSDSGFGAGNVTLKLISLQEEV